jgi:hypothetical protein
MCKRLIPHWAKKVLDGIAQTTPHTLIMENGKAGEEGGNGVKATQLEPEDKMRFLRFRLC